MKKLFILIIVFTCTMSYAQNTKLKATNIKVKYENVFYKSAQKYNKQEQKFIINKIAYSSSYKGSKSENIYQIAIYGFINNIKEQIIYNAKSVDELAHYKNIFEGRYKKILLVENAYIISSKKYYDTTISVEF